MNFILLLELQRLLNYLSDNTNRIHVRIYITESGYKELRFVQDGILDSMGYTMSNEAYAFFQFQKGIDNTTDLLTGELITYITAILQDYKN